MDLRMPEKTLAIMVKRGDNFFVPTGKTVLHAGDRLMVLTDNQKALDDTLQALGIAQDTPAPIRTRRKWTSVFFDDNDD